MPRESSAVGREPVLRISTAIGRRGDGPVVAAARESAADVPVVRTGPTGVASCDPLVLATREGETAVHPSADPETAREVAASLAEGDLLTSEAVAVVEHDPATETLPRPDDGPLAVGRRRVLGACGWADPLHPEDRPLVSPRVDVPDSLPIRGRGRGDTGERVDEVWRTARETDGDPVVVVNANEPYAGQRVDRLLLGADPIAVLDGAAVAATAVGASDVVLYLNETEETLQGHLREALDALGDDLPIDPQLVTGPDRYLAGTPTPALESLEGADRIEPRLQPPTPAEHGLYGRPTAVHTPRTLAQVAAALRDPDGFDAGEADPGTRLFSVVGDVRAPATVELGNADTLARIHEAVESRGPFQFAMVGGKFGGVTRSLDLAPTAGSLAAAGLGTDGVVELFAEDRCVVATVGDRVRFASEENAGRCVPGREGTVQLAELLREVYDGTFDTEKLRELGRVMRRSANCEIGRDASRPVLTAMDEFEPAFRAHAEGRCPAESCSMH